MPRTSAGLLLYRHDDAGDLLVLLVHPGGPYWRHRDVGAWSIPKGEVGPGEDPATVAAREFGEELGHPPPPPPWLDLGEVTQAGGKRVRAWAAEGDLDPAALASNTFELEWPPRSGRRQTFPEVDRAQWAPLEVARRLVVAAQATLLDRLVAAVTGQPPGDGADRRATPLGDAP
ncbi:MAG TPA: NUDIX domain-containing protein [Acidimicrobiales bacterium]|nr:NUDIX domain-containing protein [Acidimicrobiales bacterium]